MSDPVTRETVQSWLKAYGTACILRSGYKKQGLTAEADEQQDEAGHLERLILDVFDSFNVPGLVADGRAGVTVHDLLSDAMVNDLVGALRERVRMQYPYSGSVDLAQTAADVAGNALVNVLCNWRRDPKHVDTNVHAQTDIGWAMDRLKTLAVVGERAEQVAACEAIIRSVKVLAGS